MGFINDLYQAVMTEITGIKRYKCRECRRRCALESSKSMSIDEMPTKCPYHTIIKGGEFVSYNEISDGRQLWK